MLIPATRPLASKLYSLYRSAFAASAGVARLWSADEFAHEIHVGHVWAWQELDSIVGFLAISCAGVDAEILSVGVAPSAQNKGIAKKVINSWITQNPQAERLLLEVHEANLPARKLYEKLGFSQVSKRSGYYPDGGAALVLEKRVTR
jgi:ribosomal protein S18 acetylase RimI-like enzyme